MKLRKVMLVAALAAAIGSANMFAAMADEEDAKSGWEQSGSSWYYYENGQMVTSRWISSGDDGRGNIVYYYVDGSGVMLANTTKTIDGTSYTFGEDGSWVAPYQGATKGTVSGSTFYNTWSNLRLENMPGTVDSEVAAEDQYTGGGFESIGSPKITHDLYLTTNTAGDLEIFYADMSSKPNMDAASFAAEFANLTKGKNGTVGEVSTVTVAGQNYSKVTITKKKRVNEFYCRKQDKYMVVIATSGSKYDTVYMEALVNSITTAR